MWNQHWNIRNNRLYVDGTWTFLRIATPLRDFTDAKQVDQLIADLPILERKGYNAMKINCYWHHFDHVGRGEVTQSVEPLHRLLDALTQRHWFPILSVETYGVGGGQIPAGFWKDHPEAIAIDAQGHHVSDTEYGFGSAVPSIHSNGYQKASRLYITNLTRSIAKYQILYFETTVEPQYMGSRSLDYSPNAKEALHSWADANHVTEPPFPNAFPVTDAFLDDPLWERFRAEALADWVNGDAQAFRIVAGARALVAVDYLETAGGDMRNRNGDSLTFLTHLTCADILQVNWHWHLAAHATNQQAYDTLANAEKANGKSWVIMEHMTLNGNNFSPEEVPKVLRSTLAKGSLFGWETVNVSNSDDDGFALYHNDWSPKPVIAQLDDQWPQWQQEIAAAGKASSRSP